MSWFTMRQSTMAPQKWPESQPASYTTEDSLPALSAASESVWHFTGASETNRGVHLDKPTAWHPWLGNTTTNNNL